MGFMKIMGAGCEGVDSMINDCYYMDVYCRFSKAMFVLTDEDQQKELLIHKFDEFPHSAIGRTRGGCVKELRRRGWIFHRDGEVTCPKCAKKTGPNHGE